MEDHTVVVRAVFELLQSEGNKIKHLVSFFSKVFARQPLYETIKTDMLILFTFLETRSVFSLFVFRVITVLSR